MEGSPRRWLSRDELCHVVAVAVNCFVGAFLSCLAAYLIAHPIKPGASLADYAVAAGTTALGGALSFFAWKFFPDTRTPEQKVKDQ